VRRTVRDVVGLAIVIVLRAVVAEAQLWCRYAIRAGMVVLVAWAAWSWWLHPAITAEVARQRQAVVREVKDAATPDLDSARDRISGWIEQRRGQK
jgi:hypothetical protein